MADKTGISWTDETLNAIWGCTEVSAGCDHCYAATLATRPITPPAYQGLAVKTADGAKWTGEVRVFDDKLRIPLRQQRPRRIFVNSMSDLFHPNVATDVVDRHFAMFALARQHTFQVLTKRLARAAEWFAWLAQRAQQRNHLLPATWLVKEACEIHQMGKGAGFTPSWPLPNVWLVASAEDQATADERIPELLRCPAAVRGVSYEPALGAVDFSRWLLRPGLDWIIAGGESGPGARPPHPRWFRDARDQAQAAGVAYFFKQWGAWQLGSAAGREGLIVLSDGSTCAPEKAACEEHARLIGGSDVWSRRGPCVMTNVGKKLAGRLLDGVEHSAFPLEVGHG